MKVMNNLYWADDTDGNTANSRPGQEEGIIIIIIYHLLLVLIIVTYFSYLAKKKKYQDDTDLDPRSTSNHNKNEKLSVGLDAK